MLSGLKFIPRDQIDKVQDEKLNAPRRERKKSSGRKEKRRRKKKSSHYSSSDDGLERIKKGSKKKKKWYSSNEDLSSDSDKSESESCSDEDKNKHRDKKKFDHKGRERSKKKARSGREGYSSGESSYDSQNDDGDGGRKRIGQEKGNERKEREGGSHSLNDKDIVRTEMGLEWMLRPKDDLERKSATNSDHKPEEHPAEEIKKMNPRELNPYLKDNGSGYPEDTDGKNERGNELLSSSVVGDGGASWRLKALKRAQEQASCEGRKLEEVVEERWGSLGQLAVSVASHAAAPARVHLHAIKNRKRGLSGEKQTIADNQDERIGRRLQRDTSTQHPEMRMPKLHDSLSWGKQKSKNVSMTDVGLISSAVSSLNKFSNDGSFMHEIMRQQNDDSGGSSYTKCEKKEDTELILLESEMPSGDDAPIKLELSANQLAAKALQLRMKGKHEEAEKLLKEAENIKVKQSAREESSRPNSSRYIMHDASIRQKKKEEDADMHLAQKIVQNQRYSILGRADDEYDYDDGPRRKKKVVANDHKSSGMTNFARRILTQQERCQFCFENPTRPKHLVIAIANFAYLTLPQRQPIVPGHCCILPMQHESATRSVDNNVWDEIRNFKKCLIMMFAKQEKDLVFLETVMELAHQRRHCLVECIPLPREIAKQAPLYFKKAIDEAEDEWSQHNAKKLIDTSEKGLRGSIPKDFPYFHVEFGLDKGFVHVIDDEKQFKTNFGLNVIRGMMRLPEEDMYRQCKHESVDTQKQAVASFARDWEPFDWTKQLD